MVYEIFTYGAGEYIIEVLNANVRIMGGGNFTTALKISLLFGFFAVLWDIAVNGGFSKGAKFYITALLAYNIIFVPKVDVIITDPVATIRTDRKIDNVPFGLAFFAHTVSSLGNWLTQTFEMNLSLPDDLKYNKNGMLFGNMVVKQTYTARMQDTRTASNFNNFIRQCLIQSIHLKRVKMKDALTAEDIATLLSYGSNGVLAYEYVNTSNGVENKLCKDIINLKSDIDKEVQKTITRLQVNSKGIDGSVADYFLGIAQSTSKTFEQTLMMNAIEDSTQEYLAMTGADAGATNYAITKDDLQKKQTGIIQWIQADKYLPALKIVYETMFYALFPMVVIMLMFPNGVKIFKSSMKILIWLQLWTPLYAVLNLIMTLEQKYRMNSLLSETGGIISLYNRQAVFDISQGIAMQAGLLAWAIPVLSWKIVNGMEGFAEGLGGMSQAGMHSTNQVASEIASGNLSYGNTSFKNTSWGNENFSNISGNNTSKNKHDTMLYERGADGVATLASRYVQAPKDDLGVDVTRTERKSVAMARSVSNAENVLKAKSQDRSNAESEFNSYVSSHRNDIIKSVNESDVISKDDKKHIVGSLSTNASAGFKLFGNGAKVEAKAEAAWGKYLSHAENISESKGSNDVIATEISKRHDRVKSTTRAEREAIDNVSSKRRDYNNALSSDAQITRNINNETFEGLTLEEKKAFALDDAGKKGLASMGQKKAYSEFQNTVEPMLLEHNNKRKNTEDSLKN